jgi:SAM-dependent methyltransferase
VSDGRPDEPDLVASTLALVRDVLARSLGDSRADELVAELIERRDALGEVLSAGVNPPRTDYGDAWEQARAAAYAPTENVGAVRLELGTWTAFPAERVQQFLSEDGLSDFIRLDADARYECEVVADATALPFRSGVIDRLASNSTVEHVARPELVFGEAHRALRPGGVLVTATPFVWHEHGYPDDYVRLTRGYYERILGEVGFVDVRVDPDGSSGLYYTLHNAAKMALVDESLPEREAMARLQELVVVLLGTLIPLDRFFTHGARYWYHSVRVVARKPGTYEPSRRASSDAPFADRALDLLADPATKQPLVRRGRQLVCESTGLSYALTADGGINFLEPRLPSPGLADRAGGAARRVRDRLRISH